MLELAKFCGSNIQYDQVEKVFVGAIRNCKISKNLRWFLLCLLCFILDNGSAASQKKFNPRDEYAVYYGPWSESTIETAWDYDWIVLHPGLNFHNISADQVQKIKDGRDAQANTSDDVKVILYVSVGETREVTRGWRLAGGASGPRHRKENGELVLSNKGFDSYLLDQKKLMLKPNGQLILDKEGLPKMIKGEDGLPDENGRWGSYFVWVGDPEWHGELKERTRRLLELNADGFFWDTIDTASPWGAYGWMQGDMVEVLEMLRAHLPGQVTIMNRGLFLFKDYGERLSKAVDAVMFESYISEWNWFLNRAKPHPWYGANRQILMNDIKPWLNSSSLSLMFLNYYQPLQRDGFGYEFLTRQEAREHGALHSRSTPDLQNLWSVSNDAIDHERPLPPLRTESAIWMGRQWFVPVQLEQEHRVLARISPSWTSHDLPFIPQRELKIQGGGVLLPEMSVGKTRMLELSILDKVGQVKTLLKVKLPKLKNEIMNLAPKNLKAEGLQERVVIENVQKYSRDAYLIQWAPDEELRLRGSVSHLGSGLDEPQTVKNRYREREILRFPYVIRSLKNGQSIQWRYARLKDRQRGPWSAWENVTPKDTVPPMPIKNLRIQKNADQLMVNWDSSVSADVVSTLLYFEQNGLGLGLPIEVSQAQNKWSGVWPKGVKSVTVHAAAMDGQRLLSLKVSSRRLNKTTP